jgi:hypothetical protein
MAIRTINYFRSSLTPETVEAFICTQDWYRAEGKPLFCDIQVEHILISPSISNSVIWYIGSTQFSTAAVDDLIMEEYQA